MDNEVQQLRLEVIAIKKELEKLKDLAIKEEKERQEKERQERVRQERDRQEKERQEKERQEKERQEKERQERERIEAQKKKEIETKEREQRERKQKEDIQQKKEATSSSKATQPKPADEQQAKEVLQKLEAERRQQQEVEQEKLQSVPKSGLTAEQEVTQWVELVTGDSFGEKSLPEALKSGVILCNLINKLKPDMIKKVNKSNTPFMQMENINAFLAACGSLGVPSADLFSTVDLYDKRSILIIMHSVYNILGRISRRIPGYTGPSIGPKMADKRESHFTEEQLKKGLYTPTYGQAIQSDLQKDASAASKTGFRNVIKTNDTGTVNTGLNMFDKDKMAVQKDASAARKVGHNIIK